MDGRPGRGLFHCKVDSVRFAFHLRLLLIGQRLRGHDGQPLGSHLTGGDKGVAHRLSAPIGELAQFFIADFGMLEH